VVRDREPGAVAVNFAIRHWLRAAGSTYHCFFFRRAFSDHSRTAQRTTLTWNVSSTSVSPAQTRPTRWQFPASGLWT
jgi:hypothetical protein